MKRHVLAFDFGASSGRAMLGIRTENGITLKEIHRFSNDPVCLNDVLYWDFLRLFHEIKQGIIKAKEYGFDSIGIDTWGVDFGLIDKHGDLLGNPVHYRDSRTEGMQQTVFQKISKDEIYQITGNQFMDFNTIYQLLAVKEKDPEVLKSARGFLLMPDLINYFLTGERCAEYTIASTTQLLDASKRKWSERLIKEIGMKECINVNDFFPRIIMPGDLVGTLRPELAEELGVPQVPVIAVAEHDTQSAMIAVPSDTEDFVFISCGTWSLMGTELKEPLMNEKSSMFDMTNEGGYEGRISFLKNIAGLWLIQECRRQWMREGQEYSYSELEELARKEDSVCFINPDAAEFVQPGNMPERIREYCRKKNDRIPENVGQIVRCIYMSLAKRYQEVLQEICICTEKKYSSIHIIGGGCQSKLLCEMTEQFCNCKVIAGPVEATVLGNVMVQMIASGTVQDLKEGRSLITDYTKKESLEK